MENLIDNGEEWMLPLLEFRDELLEIRNNDEFRMTRNRLNKETLGPFRFDIRARLLEKVLVIEELTNLEIVSKQELAAIQLQWNYDGGFEYSVTDIYKKIKNKMLMLDNKKQFEKEQEELSLLKAVSENYNVNPNHIRELMITEKEYVTFLKRRNILDDIHKKIEKFATEA
jgi:DNA sulfur modification protein DndC